MAETAEVVALSAAVGALGGWLIHLILSSHGGKVEGMTREKDNKRGNEELDTYDRKVENRFDKEVRAKQVQGGEDNGRPPKLGNSHADDGGDHKF